MSEEIEQNEVEQEQEQKEQKRKYVWIDYLPGQFIHTYTREADGVEFQKFNLPKGMDCEGQSLDNCSLFTNDYQRIFPQKDRNGEVVENKYLLRLPSEDWTVNLQRSIKQEDGTYQNETVQVSAGALRGAFDASRKAYKAEQKALAQEQTQDVSHEQKQEHKQEKTQSKAR